MAGLAYALSTALEAAGSIVGIRSGYEQPAYTVLRTLPDDVELRRYGRSVAVEASLPADQPDAANRAFKALFAYISDANAKREKIKMTVPVSQSRTPSAAGSDTFRMRFFLPPDVAAKGAPAPTDRILSIVDLPAREVGVIRFTGLPGPALRDRKRALLERTLKAAGVSFAGPPYLLTYDPPFAVPFLRRNEIAVDLSPTP